MPSSDSLHRLVWFSQAAKEWRGRLVGGQYFEFREWLELKSVCAPSLVIVCLGLRGALFTGADTPGAAQSPNCFTVSLSRARRSLRTRTSRREALRGRGRVRFWRLGRSRSRWGEVQAERVSNSPSDCRQQPTASSTSSSPCFPMLHCITRNLLPKSYLCYTLWWWRTVKVRDRGTLCRSTHTAQILHKPWFNQV